MGDSGFQLQKEPVYGRDDSPIKMFAGLSVGEIIALLLIAILVQLLFRATTLTFGALVLAYAYFRYLRSILPDRFFANAWRYYTRSHEVYRAGGRDYEWRPPVISPPPPRG